MCNKDDFIKKEDEFISQLLASDIYKEYLESVVFQKENIFIIFNI